MKPTASTMIERLENLDPSYVSRARESAGLIEQLLINIGENPGREGLKDTPMRVEKALRFLTSGYIEDIDALIGNAIFNEPAGELVFVKDIEFYSLCEHHMLPFFGKVHVAYIPNGKVIGLSKIPRIVEAYARRLQVQERLTSEIAHQLMKSLEPKGVLVIAEASHMCMMMRGIQKQLSTTVTKTGLGDFKSNSALQSEIVSMLGK